MSQSDQVYYFGYASNLLKEKLHLQNPDAEFDTIARLNKYKFGFDYESPSWKGASATVTYTGDEKDDVWGVVWKIARSGLSALDDKEGVTSGVYERIRLDVVTAQNKVINCEVCRLLKVGYDDRRPSPQYKSIILHGALQSGLPESYVSQLRAFEDNGFTGSVQVFDQLKLKLIS